MKARSVFVWVWLCSWPASAVDTWSEPFPGIRHLHRTGPAQLNVHAAVIDLCTPGVSVRHTAFEERQQRTSSFATSVGAQLAINGDFSCRPIDVGPNSPFAPCVGRPVYGTYGIAAHAGQPWPDTIYLDALLGFGQGRVQMYDNDEDQPFNPDWMSEVISGHGSIVRDGQLTIHDCPINPRTAIGLSADHTEVMVAVADGRNGWRGMTCLEIGALLIELGAERAFALDGGGSSTFWLEGEGVLNHPSDGVERVVGPHLAFFASGTGAAPFCEAPFSVHPEVPLPNVQAVGPKVGYVPLTPLRLFDTRHPTLSTGLMDIVRGPDDKLAARSTVSFSGFVDAPGVALNVTVANPSSAGFVSVWPSHLPQPDVSAVNFAAQQSVANLVGLPLGPERSLSFYTHAATHLLGDVQGYFQTSGAGFLPEAPHRLVDTRSGNAIAAGTHRQVVAPDASVVAVALQVTTVDPAAGGFVTLFPCEQPVPDASHLNHLSGENRAASVIAKMGPNGICAYSYAETHLLVDVHGTFRETSALRFQSVHPTRMMDTRKPDQRWRGRIDPGHSVRLPFLDMPGVPANAQAVWVNLTAVSPVDQGFVSLTPCGASIETSVLNFREERNTAATVVMGLDASGSLCLKSSVRTHLLVDMFGYFTPAPEPEPPDFDAGSAPSLDGDGGAGHPAPSLEGARDGGQPREDAGGGSDRNGNAYDDGGAGPANEAGPGQMPQADGGTQMPEATADPVGVRDDATVPDDSAPVPNGFVCGASSSTNPAFVWGLLGMIGFVVRRRRKTRLPNPRVTAKKVPFRTA